MPARSVSAAHSPVGRCQRGEGVQKLLAGEGGVVEVQRAQRAPGCNPRQADRHHHQQSLGSRSPITALAIKPAIPALLGQLLG